MNNQSEHISAEENSQSFDIVIPAHKKDLKVLEYCVRFARKNLIGAGRIIIVSKERYSTNAEWFDESLFPFSFDLVKQFVGGGSAGWYFQQLLKFYSPFVIPNISSRVLILDSDTVFFRRNRMIDKDGRMLFNISKDQNITEKNFDINVNEHIKILLPSIANEYLPSHLRAKSGVSHHMLFERSILQDLFSQIENHDGSGDPFFKIF